MFPHLSRHALHRDNNAFPPEHAFPRSPGWVGGRVQEAEKPIPVFPCRSVYLHNNQLSNAGLPPDAFRGSPALTTLSLSSNRLHYVPANLPTSLERLHLQVRLPDPFLSTLGSTS